MDPATLAQLSQQATNILVPALSALCIAGKPAVDKGKEVLTDMIYEKTFEKLGSGSGKRAQALLEKISPKMGASLKKALTKVSENSEDPKSKEELQQEILKLLRENPDLVREIELIINLNVENIDQFAVGNYNNFFNFKTLSGNELIKIIGYLDQRRKEAANQEVLNRYNPSTLPYYPEKLKLFVTENRSEELRKALTYLENRRILLISGVGGVGKSTLARSLVDLRPVNVPEPFWFDFNQNQSGKLGDILEKLASYLKAPEIASFKDERREPGKLDVDKLTGEFQRRSEVWLIFDDLSTILEDQHFADNGIELLFSSLRHNIHNAKVIVTSRTLPIFENGEKLIDAVENENKQDLKGLKLNFAVNYLEKNKLANIESKNLEELATGVDGHPLALKILVELVKEFGATDVIQNLSIYQKDKEDTIIKARKLFDKLAGNEKEFLEHISVYRQPVSIKGLNEMLAENTPPVNAIRKLIDKSLLETDHNGKYWLHPLVQEFSYEDLKNKKEAHMLAVKYYLFPPPPENPTKKEDLQPVIEAHYHACKAEEYDLAADIIFRNNIPYFLDLWENPRTQIEIYEKLLPEYHFDNEPILSNKQAQVVVLGLLGSIYSYLDKPKREIEYYEQALKISKEMGDKVLEIAALGSLCLAYGDLGEPEKAIEYQEQALKISREIGDKREEGNNLGSLGLVYTVLGEPEKAIECHKQAVKIFKKIGDRKGESEIFGYLGLAYRNLGEPIKAIDYYKKGLQISREIGDRKREGNLLGNLGLTYFVDVRESRKAIEHYEEGVKIAKDIGDRREQSAILEYLGNAYCELGKPIKAIEYYKQALQISIEVGDIKREGNLRGDLGSLYLYLGKSRVAIKFLKKSIDIGKEIKDTRIINFCEQKLNEIEGD